MGSDTDVIRADQAAKLTGLTVHRLRHWDRTGFFVPSFAAKNRRSPFSRVYSFKDLLSLRLGSERAGKLSAKAARLVAAR
jgi:MerR HTH family regulatory protein